MTSTLDSAPVRAEIAAMLAAADAQEPELHAMLAELAPDGGVTETELAPHLRDAWICVPREVGELLAMLVRSTGARTVVEFGTSFGVSTVFLAAALRDNGGGTVISTEIERPKADVAQAHLVASGLSDLADIRVGDALETLRDLPSDVDLLLLDGWSELYLPVLSLVEPRLRTGALVVADDTGMFPDTLAPYLAHVRDGGGYRSVALGVGDGVELSIRG
jgi:predicted O-methyltransferase YrrM